ncbi:UNKNOWN [Stylonychia lemnae]|uniref:Uncharacterized protein n=1 Tax=Stylonychia lemnae TaxID=5949 RepID=A0A077ZZB3_STYLE|nr:UNKNOWN [Stylonychia lemnae]|eukprot:CDW74927.1 UNKNOWN [Stylonychia lemnae]
MLANITNYQQSHNNSVNEPQILHTSQYNSLNNSNLTSNSKVTQSKRSSLIQAQSNQKKECKSALIKVNMISDLQQQNYPNQDESLDFTLDNSNSISINYDENSVLLVKKSKQIQINLDSLDTKLKVPQQRNGNFLNSQNDQSMFMTNEWVAGSAKTLNKTKQGRSRGDYEYGYNQDINQSSKKSVAADSDRSNIDLRLRQENIMLRQEILKLKKALYMNNQPENPIDKQEYKMGSPQKFNDNNQVIPEITGSREFSPEIIIQQFPQESLIMNNLMSDPDNITPYPEIPLPCAEPLKPLICSTNQSVARGGTFQRTQDQMQMNNFEGSQQLYYFDANNRQMPTDNSLCQNGESIELRLSLINQATFQNKLDGQFQRDTEDYRRFSLKDLEKSYENNEERLRLYLNSSNIQNDQNITGLNILQDSDQNILNDLTLSKDDYDDSREIQFHNQQREDPYEITNQIKADDYNENLNKKRNSSVFEIQRHYEIEIENLRKDLEMMKKEEHRIKQKMDKQDFPLVKEFTFKNDGKQLFEKIRNQKSSMDSSLIQTEDPSFCAESKKFVSNPNSNNQSFNNQVTAHQSKISRHSRYMSNGIIDESQYIPINRQIWQPPSFNNTQINTVHNSPVNSNMFNSCQKQESKSIKNDIKQDMKADHVQSINSKNMNQDYQRLDTEAIELMFENPQIQSEFLPLDMVSSQKVRYYNNQEEIDDYFPRFINHGHQSGDRDLNTRINQCIKLIDNVQTDRLSEESNYNQSIDFPFRSNQKQNTQTKVSDIKFETQNFSQESPIQIVQVSAEKKETKLDSPSFGGNNNFRFPNIYETNESVASIRKQRQSIDHTQKQSRPSSNQKGFNSVANKSPNKSLNKTKLFQYPAVEKFNSRVDKPKSLLKNYNKVLNERKFHSKKSSLHSVNVSQNTNDFPYYQDMHDVNEKYMVENNYKSLSNQLQQSRSQSHLNKLSKKSSNHSQNRKPDFDNSACKSSYFQDVKRISLAENIKEVIDNQQKKPKASLNNTQISQGNKRQSTIGGQKTTEHSNSQVKNNHVKLLNSNGKYKNTETVVKYETSQYQSPFKKRTEFSAGKYPNQKLYSQIQYDKLSTLEKLSQQRRNSINLTTVKINKNPKFINKDVNARQQPQEEPQIINYTELSNKINSTRTPQPQSPEKLSQQSERFVVENQLFMSVFNNARNVEIFNQEKGCMSTNRSGYESTLNGTKQSSTSITQNSTPIQSSRTSPQVTSLFQRLKPQNILGEETETQQHDYIKVDKKSTQNSSVEIKPKYQEKPNLTEKKSSLKSFLQIANSSKKVQTQNLFKRNSNISQNSVNTSSNGLRNESKSKDKIQKSPLICKQSSSINKSLSNTLNKSNIPQKPKIKSSLFVKNTEKSRANQTIVNKSKDKYFNNSSNITLEDTNHTNRMSRQSSNQSLSQIPIQLHTEKTNLKQTVTPQIYGKLIKVFNEVNLRKFDLEPIVEDC